jgi:hypothetical protein
MNQADVMLKIVERAQAGGALPVEEAIAQIARLINLLDPHAVHYEADVALLVKIGATVSATAVQSTDLEMTCEPHQSHGRTRTEARAACAS